MKHDWYAQSVTAVLRNLETNKQGLTETSAKKRLKVYGQNSLPAPEPDGLQKIFFRQFQSPLIYLLLLASVVVYITGELTDSVIIFVVLIFNAIIGTIQEGRAQNALAALRAFVETKATVLRDNKEMIVADTEVVPGDIIILHEGDKIPADSRVMEGSNLTLDEASLTGESQPVVKTSEILNNIRTETDQTNMVFKGTHVVAGTGSAIVVATGLQTMIGKISATVSTIKTDDPLKKDIAQLSKLIILVTTVIAITIFVIGIARQQSLLEMFATVVSLSVSIIPEGLPIVITLVLATGMWRMSKQNALVKKLQAVESLGQAHVIAVDKTGTITKNEMTLQKVYVGGNTYDITGSGYEPVGQVTYKGQPVELAAHSALMKAAQYAGYCANAHASQSEDTKMWQVSGDPTEASMLVFAEKLGFNKLELEKHAPLIAELPFSSQTKYHATLHQQGKTNVLVAIGAPEIILHHSSKIILKTEKAETLTAATKRTIESNIEKLSGEGLRVLGIAVMESKNHTINVEDISGLTFIGLFGIRDALRPEVHEAVAKANSAGIKVVMITGDHVTTARAIATQAGIFKNGDNILTGQELDALSAAQLSKKLNKTSVFARVSPTHKLKIIEAYQHLGKIIAMTGDGVNDAPSLVAADLGVAMGGIGTEVAKEAADIILLDDNFGSMVSAIEEGRSIYKTIKKVILYLFSTGLGEVLTIAGALIIALPLPVTPTQIIWLNFVTDGFLVVALGMEPKEHGLLKSTFTSQSKSLVDMLMAKRILIMGVTMMVGTLALFNQYLTLSPEKAGTIALTVLAIFQWFNAWNARSETRSIFTINPFSNLYLLGALGMVITLQLLAVYNPIAQKLLHTTPLSFHEWIICITAASSILVVEEIRKSLARAKLHRN